MELGWQYGYYVSLHFLFATVATLCLAPGHGPETPPRAPSHTTLVSAPYR